MNARYERISNQKVKKSEGEQAFSILYINSYVFEDVEFKQKGPSSELCQKTRIKKISTWHMQ